MPSVTFSRALAPALCLSIAAALAGCSSDDFPPIYLGPVSGGYAGAPAPFSPNLGGAGGAMAGAAGSAGSKPVPVAAADCPTLASLAFAGDPSSLVGGVAVAQGSLAISLAGAAYRLPLASSGCPVQPSGTTPTVFAPGARDVATAADGRTLVAAATFVSAYDPGGQTAVVTCAFEGARDVSGDPADRTRVWVIAGSSRLYTQHLPTGGAACPQATSVAIAAPVTVVATTAVAGSHGGGAWVATVERRGDAAANAGAGGSAGGGGAGGKAGAAGNAGTAGKAGATGQGGAEGDSGAGGEHGIGAGAPGVIAQVRRYRADGAPDAKAPTLAAGSFCGVSDLLESDDGKRLVVVDPDCARVVVFDLTKSAPAASYISVDAGVVPSAVALIGDALVIASAAPASGGARALFATTTLP